MYKIFRYFILIILILFIIIIIFKYKHHLNSINNFFTNIFYTNKNQKIEPRLEKTVRLIEGWTSRDMGNYFENQGIWQSEEFLEIVGFPRVDYNQEKDLPPLEDFSDNFSFLADKPKNRSLEGYLYPDTYRIYATSSPRELVIKMLNNFDKKLTPEMRTEIKKQGKTIYEIVTMASLLEKEAPINYQNGDNHDAKIIAGIFWKRLANNQPLQSCATLAYILGVNKLQYSSSDIEVESPYNTYKYKGLPPGPISNPGILAIEAAIYPIETDYNYFLTPAGSKDVIYSSTYNEHLLNKNKYLP